MASLTSSKLTELVRARPDLYNRYLDLIDSLNLCGLSLTDLDAISDCPNLRVLYANENCITDFGKVNLCTQLNSLFLNHNDIRRIPSTLGSLNIRVLSLSCNNLESLSGIDKLLRLEVLDVSGNALTNYTHIASCHKLTSLNLSYNKISDLDLESLSCLRSLRCLYINDNPCSARIIVEAIVRAIPSLEFLDNMFVRS